MRAAVLSIGDELTAGVTADGNGRWLAERLRGCGVEMREMRIVPDDRSAIARAIADLAGWHDLLIITGGLGPTPDDLTREALGDVITPGEALELDAEGLKQIEGWYSRAGRAMPAVNRKQAMRPRGAAILPNTRGTAPGMRGEWRGCSIFVLPGVPAEMRAMFEGQVAPHLPGQALIHREVHTFGLGESDLAERLGEILARTRQDSVRVGTAAHEGIVSVRIYAEPDSHRATEDILAEVEKRTQPYAFGRDEETLAGVVGRLLKERNRTLATAESCTGGMLGAMITEVPGCSACYRGGWVTYSNEMKEQHLGVPRDLLGREGAVSAVVARAMAEGALARSGADVALSITGIAGPISDDTKKPVGMVFIACLYREEGGRVREDIREFGFGGERQAIRRWSAQSALQMARFALLGAAADARLNREVQVEAPRVPDSGVLPARTSARLGEPRAAVPVAKLWTPAWIALGANLGERRAAIESAVQRLREHASLRVLAVSSIMETEPVGPVDQPAYLNAAAAVNTTLSPRELLDVLLEIERGLGRDRAQSPRWGPRTIDLDLLFYGDAVIDEGGLTVPHPRMHERMFVLQPLAEIAPNALHPLLGRTVAQLLRDLAAAEK